MGGTGREHHRAAAGPQLGLGTEVRHVGRLVVVVQVDRPCHAHPLEVVDPHGDARNRVRRVELGNDVLARELGLGLEATEAGGNEEKMGGGMGVVGGLDE